MDGTEGALRGRQVEVGVTGGQACGFGELQSHLYRYRREKKGLENSTDPTGSDRLGTRFLSLASPVGLPKNKGCAGPAGQGEHCR